MIRCHSELINLKIAFRSLVSELMFHRCFLSLFCDPTKSPIASIARTHIARLVLSDLEVILRPIAFGNVRSLILRFYVLSFHSRE